MTNTCLRQRLMIGTWNVRTLYRKGNLKIVTSEMKRYGLDVLGLCETRWTGSGQIRTADGHTFLFSGRDDERHHEGVGILISKAVSDNIVSWEPVSERIITVRLKTKFRNMTIIQVYAPTEDKDDETKEKFYGQLSNVLAKTGKSDIQLVMGDFNAKVGKENEGIENVMGKFGTGERNNNGDMLVEFCGCFDLMIGGTMFQHKKCHKVTWVSPDNKTQNQIDHICINKQFRKILEDVRNRRGADVGSDHHLVTAALQLKFKRYKIKRERTRQKFDTRLLANPETKEKFRSCLQNFKHSSNHHETIDEFWTDFKTATTEFCESELEQQNQSRKDWMSNETWQMIENRRQIKVKISGTNDRQEKEKLVSEYNTIHKEISKKTRSDYRKYIDDLSKCAEDAASKNDLRELHTVRKELTNSRKTTPAFVKDKNGHLLVRDEDQTKRWKEYFQELLESPEDVPETEDQQQQQDEATPSLKISTAKPTHLEISNAIKELKNGKSAGVDNIPPEIYKTDTNAMAKVLMPLFEKIWQEEKIPSDWKMGLIVKIPKKGDLSCCSNWRGLCLLNIASKILTKIILNRIVGCLDALLRKEQAGFRSGRSCIDLINTLRIIIEQTVEWQTPLYLVFVDFATAFDRVKRGEIWKSLKEHGVPPKIVNLIRECYDGFQCKVTHKGGVSESFETTAGVRQGCLLSPLLFLLVIDGVMRRVVAGKNRGISWFFKHLEDMDYADDIVLMSHSFADMQSKLDDLVNEAAKVGLKINIGKTKVMKINVRNNTPLKIGDTNLEEVDEFVYLGSTITKDGGAVEDVKRRINIARGSFIQHREVWRSNVLSNKTKIRLFKSNILTVLLYGCETWLVNQEIQNKLQVFVNRCLRNIFKIWWPKTISNEDLWQKAEIGPINQEIKKRKWGWIGHTMRKDDNEIAKQAFNWNPQGSRKRGRPKKTWKRTITEEAHPYSLSEIRSMAKNRTRFRIFVETLCST